MKDEMHMIPYIEHCNRLYHAYRREKILKILLISTNAVWLIASAVHLVARKPHE